MGMLTSLSALFRPGAVKSPNGFPPRVARQPDPPTMILGRPGRDGPFTGVTFMIEYSDVNDNVSRRRISLRRVASKGRTHYLQAWCHERDDWRTFRVDRVLRIVDLDGEIHDDANGFLFQLGVLSAESLSRDSKHHPLRHLDRCLPGVRALAALAHSDGMLEQAEVKAILDYLGHAAKAAGDRLTAPEREELSGAVTRLFVAEGTFKAALRKLTKQSSEGQGLFLDAARAVMTADGRFAPEELTLVQMARSALAY
jgi:hypothetical protein